MALARSCGNRREGLSQSHRTHRENLGIGTIVPIGWRREGIPRVFFGRICKHRTYFCKSVKESEKVKKGASIEKEWR
jgi:hypothetical protein